MISADRRHHTDRFQELDLLRGFAAAFVLFFHLIVRYDRMVPAQGPSGPLWGNYGVYLFFIISGFVIFMSLDRCKHPLDFIVSRFSRLYPTYWAAVLLTFAVGSVFPLPEQNYTLSMLAVNLTMLQMFTGVASIDGVYWSLGAELCFYAVMLLLFISTALRQAELIAFAWINLSIAAALILNFGYHFSYTLSMFLVLSFAAYFVAGIVFYRVWLGGYTRIRLLLLFLCVVADGLTRGPASAVIATTLFLLFHFVVTGRLTKLRVGPLLWLGAVSYPLYLTHQMIGYRAIYGLDSLGLPRGAAVAIVAVGAIVLASALTLLIERPAMRALRMLWQRPRAGFAGKI